MKILINTRNIKIIEKEKIYTGNVNTYIINVEYEDYNFFSEYNCYLTFKNNDLKKKVIIGPDLKVIIPFDVLSETGNLIIGFFAIKVDEKEKLIRYSSEIEVLPVEKGGFDEEASEPEELTPTILEKYLQEMKNFYNESLEEFNRNATNKTEEFNKNYENKVNSFNNNATQKTNEYNKNADKRIEEINNKVSDIEKIENNIEEIQKNIQASEQNAKTSETNAKTSEQNAQKSAENASEVLTNVTTIQEDINKFKGEINTAKESVDKSLEKVYSAVTEATNQAKESKKQAGIATSIANQTSTDKSAVETMRNEVSSMKTSIEQTKTDTEKIKNDTQAIKDDVETLKEETLEAKEDVESSLEKERIESDKKYAKAIDSEVIEIDNFGQVECDDDGYMKDIEIESNLEVTQDVTETSPSLDYPSEFKNIKRELSIINNQENYINTTQIANKTFSSNGLSVSTDENGIFTVNGTHSEQVSVDFNNLDFKLRSGQKIKLININGINDTSNNLTDIIRVLFWDFYFKDVGQINMYVNIVQGGNVNRASIKFLIPDGKTTVTYDNFKFGIMVVDDESIENYVPYNGYSEKVTLPENNFLGAFNGYKNYIKDNKLKSNLKIIEFDGTENWYSEYTPIGVRFIVDLDKSIMESNSNTLKSFCSHLKLGASGATYNKNDFYVLINESTRTRLFCGSFESTMTVENWKAFLLQQKEAGTPFQIFCICGEKETPLDDINLPIYQGINNISLEDLKLNFKYNVSIEKYIENNNIIERKISNSKYARALKTQVEDIEQIQVYAENDEVENLTIKGTELTQKTREGYNQLKNTGVSRTHNGIDFTVNADGTVLANGTANGGTSGTSLSQINIHDEEIIFETGAYTIQDCKAYVVYEDNSYEWFDGLTKATSKTFDKSFKITDVYIQVNPGTTVNNKLYYPMITKGTENKEYEQYGASPSLDYPSDIQVVNEQKILICRKNLIKSIQYADNVDRYGWVLRFEAPLKSNTEYTIGLIGAKDNKYYLAEDLVKGGGIVLTVTMTGTMQYITFTTKENISVSPTYVENEGGYILFKNSTSQPNNHIFEDVILIEGNVDAKYEPYEGQELSIPLQNLAINDYSDIIDRENKKQDKILQEFVLTGDENWLVSGSNDVTNGFQLYLDNSVENYIGLCNYLKTGISGNVEKFTPLGTSLYIAVNKTRASTVEEFKALLAQLYSSGKPMKFYLIKTEAETEPLTEEVKQELDKFKLYNDLNNIFIDNGSLSFKYNKSLLRAFEEQSELSASLLERIQALEQAQVNSVGGN